VGRPRSRHRRERSRDLARHTKRANKDFDIGQIRMLRDGISEVGPVLLVERFAELSGLVYQKWTVETLHDGRSRSTTSQELGRLMNEMEALAWVAG
jgi:hypothetical protein